MLYDYICSGCSGTFEICKKVIHYDRDEFCPTSGTLMARVFKPKIHLYGTEVESAYFNVALGEVVKGKADALEKAKAKGMIEVGNEKPAKHIKWTPKEY